MQHEIAVDAWLERAQAPTTPAAVRLRLFEEAMTALWCRSELTLGPITLAAIFDRVLFTCAANHPAIFEGVRADGAGGADYSALHQRLDAVPPADLAAAVRFALIEFLSVIGNLTAEILTPALHETLADVGNKDA